MPTINRFKPPLDLPTLREIQSRRSEDEDVHALLWEIRRLHATIARADQLMRTIDESGGIAHRMVADAMRRDLAEEPCLDEMRKARADLAAEPEDQKPYRHPTDR